MQIKSEEIKDTTLKYTKIYEIERDGESKDIQDEYIIDEITADKRAVAEFLENGEKQDVEFTTNFVDLKINDIVKVLAPEFRVPKDLSKSRFIVKNIKHYISGKGYIKTKIKVVRYD